MKKLLLALCVVLPLSAVAVPMTAEAGLCSSIRGCFRTNRCIDALIDEGLFDAALQYYGENCCSSCVET